MWSGPLNHLLINAKTLTLKLKTISHTCWPTFINFLHLDLSVSTSRKLFTCISNICRAVCGQCCHPVGGRCRSTTRKQSQEFVLMETGSAAGGKLIIPGSIGMTAFSLQVKPQSQTVAVTLQTFSFCFPAASSSCCTLGSRVGGKCCWYDLQHIENTAQAYYSCHLFGFFQVLFHCYNSTQTLSALHLRT